MGYVDKELWKERIPDKTKKKRKKTLCSLRMDEVQLPQGYKESLYFLALKNNCKSNKFLYFIRYDNIEARNYYVSFIIIIV